MAKKTAEDAPQTGVVLNGEPVAGKGRATPSRREREAANRRPIVVTDRKAARRQSRTREAEARERARIGLANGEERYLPARDRGSQRRFARDFVDSQWTIGEFLIPVFVLFFVATLVLPQASWLFLPLYGYLALTIVDGLLRAAIIRRRLAQKLGDRTKVERGLNLYVVMRSAQFRNLRVPKALVKRGTRVTA
ncbi:DUF3043 domain-containing protein [Amnibacterium kyonggiense]|uniref:DUF3043 family protein n=1 Tax=Amnibacterium kyonggiense TaxID=595671 RepID=A0A4R7FL05_9MICO|nr:DUF3043 domain-containing protein [Amnibacterium kyonggiense]TDS77039.1 Protein of unknown function (DUF3043) [Amnibacterium kyonggiense]